MRWALYFGVTACAWACQTVNSDRIHAGDLASVVPAFAALDSSVELAPAPMPGVRRVFQLDDLARLARMNGIQPPHQPQEICVERPAKPRTRAAAVPVRLGPPAVQRGETVAVRVFSGAVLLSFAAEAESSGRTGQNVIVKNPENGRRFIARVEDKGKVVVKK